MNFSGRTCSKTQIADSPQDCRLVQGASRCGPSIPLLFEGSGGRSTEHISSETKSPNSQQRLHGNAKMKRRRRQKQRRSKLGAASCERAEKKIPGENAKTDMRAKCTEKEKMFLEPLKKHEE
jgi:hypothetical protein